MYTIIKYIHVICYFPGVFSPSTDSNGTRKQETGTDESCIFLTSIQGGGQIRMWSNQAGNKLILFIVYKTTFIFNFVVFCNKVDFDSFMISF